MKTIARRLFWLCLTLPAAKPAFSQANAALSNLVNPAVNVDLLPAGDNVQSIGSVIKSWKILYLDNSVYLGGSKFISFGSAITLRNTAVGYTALGVNSSGTFNSAFGASALQANTTGFGNVAIGYSALYGNTSGSANIAIGIRSLNNNVSGKSLIGIGDSTLLHQNGGPGFNIAIGAKALYSNTTGDHNTAIGSASFYSNTTGRNNVGIGSSALYNNTGGSENNALGHGTLLLNTTGSSNVAIGAFAMNNNSSGFSNIAIGSRAMNGNKTSSQNIAIGDSALYTSAGTTESNIAIGSKALYSNAAGSANTALGYHALTLNSTATSNTAVGYLAAANNVEGRENTAIGREAMPGNVSGVDNVAVGYIALQLNNGSANTGVGAGSLLNNVSGIHNTAVGFLAEGVENNLTNATSLGYESVATGSNTVTLGNTSVTTINGAVNFTLISDGRFKKDIRADVPGLAFIRALRPVTYNYDIHGLNDHLRPGGNAGNALGKIPAGADADEKAIEAKERIRYTGFIAQEVETAAGRLNYDFSAVHKPQGDKDTYGLSYSDFVAPLVKGMQDLSDSNDSKSKKIDSLEGKVDSLEARLQRLEQLMTGGASTGISINGGSLDQNQPNPFRGSTRIRYQLPAGGYRRAKILIADMQGRIIQTVNVTGSGAGVLNLDAAGLASGSYPYALYVDDQLVGSKQMMVVK